MARHTSMHGKNFQPDFIGPGDNDPLLNRSQRKLNLSSNLFFAPQLQQNLAAIVADLEIQNSICMLNVPSKLSVARLSALHFELLSYLSQKNKHWQTFEEETSNLGIFHT